MAAKRKASPQPGVKVVEAVGTATQKNHEFSKLLENAMVAAVEDAHERGITDADEIRELKLQAAKGARDQIRAKVAEMAEEASKPKE